MYPNQENKIINCKIEKVKKCAGKKKRSRNCLYHAGRNDCYTLICAQKKDFRHVTQLSRRSDSSTTGQPQCLQFKANANRRGVFNELAEIETENLLHDEWISIESAGEMRIDILSKLLLYMKNVFRSEVDPQKHLLLMSDRKYFDLIYSTKTSFEIIWLPQLLFKFGPTQQIGNFLFYGYNNDKNLWSFILKSQKLYQKFIIINTILTATLKEENPFNRQKNISTIIRTMGECPNNVNCIGSCSLTTLNIVFKKNHIFCMPIEFLKRIYVYQTITDKPNKIYRFADSVITKKNIKNGKCVIKTSQLHNWFLFTQEFEHYFADLN